MTSLSPKVAFVAGCNGISGNAIVESKIVVTSRSPLKNYWQDPRVEFLALDFLSSIEELVQKMSVICDNVTHAYFTSYVHTDDFARLRDLNVPLFTNFLTAIDTVAGESLQRVCLQTGGKHYGIHLGPVIQPLTEELPRYDDHNLNFYYDQEDFMFKLHKERQWSWNVIRPNAIIGFTPSKNGMSETITLALYMLICKELGQVPRFPGNKYFYNVVNDCSSATGLADMSVWATTHEQTKNEAFNHVNGDTYVWRYFFKKIGRYFGIDIPDQIDFDEEADDSKMIHSFRLTDWASNKREVWHRVCDKYGGNKDGFEWGAWSFFDWSLGRAWPTLSSITKARKFGWTRYDDTYENWIETFKSFENAGILPENRDLLSR